MSSSRPAPAGPELDSGGIAPDADDADLVARVRVGDVAAFEQVYRVYHVPLCVFAAGFVGARDIAEELVHDVLCHIWERRAVWSVAERGVRGYVYSAVRNRAINWLQHRRVVDRATDWWQDEEAAIARAAAPGMGQGPAAPEDRLHAAEINRAVLQAIATLPPRCREAYLLRWRHGLTHPEIARTMGVSVKAVEIQMAKALRAVRTALDGMI